MKKSFWLKFIFAAAILASITAAFLWPQFFAPAEKNGGGFQNAEDVAPGSIARIFFFDVGQGDSSLVVFPDNKTVLIDCGDFDASGSLSIKIKGKNVSDISALVITHAHSDHYGGCFDVLANFNISFVFEGPFAEKNGQIEKLNSLALARNSQVKNLFSGREISLGGAKILVLSPGKDFHSENENENSLVLKFVFENFSALFMGDAGFSSEEFLMSRFGPDLQSNVLKAGHHGSGYSTSKGFLSRVRPDVSIISVGAKNNYGHPSNRTLENLRAASSEIFRTDFDGDVGLVSDGNSCQIS